MFDKFRLAMETASMLIVALEKVKFNNEAYRQNLETQLYDLLSDNYFEEDDSQPMQIIK